MLSGIGRGRCLQHCVNIVAAVVVFCLLPLLFAVAVRIAIAASRSGAPAWITIAIALGSVPALCVAAAWWIGHHGAPESAVVTGKSEVLEISSEGLTPSVGHRLILTVASAEAMAELPVPARRNPLLALLRRRGDLEFDVDEGLYDSVKEGDTLPLHRIHLGPLLLARPDTEEWWDIAPGRLERLVPWLHAAGAPACVNGHVAAVRTVRDAYEISLVSSSDQGGAYTVLKQPYDEVRFRFTTAQGAEILALDRVDAGSAGPLNPGDTRQVCYSTGRPRLARLTVGTRAFEWRNAWDYWRTEILAFVAALTAMGIALGIWGRLKRRLPGRRLPRPGQ